MLHDDPRADPAAEAQEDANQHADQADPGVGSQLPAGEEEQRDREKLKQADDQRQVINILDALCIDDPFSAGVGRGE